MYFFRSVDALDIVVTSLDSVRDTGPALAILSPWAVPGLGAITVGVGEHKEQYQH